MITKDVFMKKKIPIIEIFNSVSGEGISAGYIVTFIRVAGCNLRCIFCDTRYSYENITGAKEMLPEQILENVEKYKCTNIICTGGEPLELEDAKRYIPIFLASMGYDVRIETNGSCEVYTKEELQDYGMDNDSRNVYYSLDVKCPSSGMSKFDLIRSNIHFLKKGDELKFVVGNESDFDYSINTIKMYKELLSNNKIIINFSPIFNKMDSSKLVESMKSYNSYFSDHDLKVRLSLQIHKYIWDPQKRGV